MGGSSGNDGKGVNASNGGSGGSVGGSTDGLPGDIRDELEQFLQRTQAEAFTNIGFPAAVDIDYGPLLRLLASGPLLNNIGDPFGGSGFPHHTKQFERFVVEWIATLLRASDSDWWGYVTSGATEGNEYAIRTARARCPGGVVYHSAMAHTSVFKIADGLGMPSVPVRTDQHGQLDYEDLAAQVSHRRDRPVIVVATAGTTMTEAIDDIRVIHGVLDDLAVPDTRRYVHVDAALSGLPLALLDVDDPRRPGFDFADGADSVILSGHKFLGTPIPCGVVVTRNTQRAGTVRPGGYTGSPDATVTGSRNGYATLLLWYALRSRTVDDLRARADKARRLAAYAHRRLAGIDWPAFRHDLAFTVVLDVPPPSVLKKWPLASDSDRAHIVCMPGVTFAQVDTFVSDLEEAASTQSTPVPVLAPVTSSGSGWLARRSSRRRTRDSAG